jgi:hypothetical protein
MGGLPNYLERERLKAVERKGLPVDNVRLVNLCNSNEGVFGKAGSETGHAIQSRFGKINRLAPMGNLRLLKNHEIEPSPSALKRHDKEP